MNDRVTHKPTSIFNRNQQMVYARSFKLLGKLLKQGYSMDHALSFMLIHLPKEVSVPLTQVQASLKNGQEIHQSFSQLPVPRDVISFLYFYQYHGQVSDGFIQAGTLLEKRQVTKHQMYKLLRYPVMLVWICFVVLIVLHLFVVPHFNSLFETMQGDTPLLTTIVLHSLSAIPYIGAATILLAVFSLFYMFLFKKRWPPSRRMKFLLNTPFVNQIVKQLSTYFFSLQIGRLLLSGTSLQQALSLFEKQNHLPFFQQEVIKIKSELQLGTPFYLLVKEKDYFIKELSFVIENGERTGYLGEDLENFSTLIYSELEEKLTKVMDYLQPFIFILIGAFIFILFLAIMLPMFQMIGSLQ
ncbi:competence type IV pilus assembly protein ComGB [Alkalihalophilus pseudofirmus]|uniref:Competence type IV pilus assembly protein ComGB n=1 Tax=Alkalihalophilus pseudofirmus TaxID=79885 RepID=A0AAJ2NNF8_ALKPS|nr:competence type IV pilus assembly protein ComGB [Alkalihalophilus pseudofirmus]MDV2885591.1 competence type IV pilus assembly protein ComGB [Alkalihalophilus pseudofirmus]